ncbi:MAG: hypothetical protein ACLSWY_02015 [Ruthenibacterium lactatiformans]
MEQTGKFSNGRAALGLLALVILAAAQLGAQLLASLPLMVGAPVWLGNVLAGVLYAALGWRGFAAVRKGPARDAGGMPSCTSAAAPCLGGERC